VLVGETQHIYLSKGEPTQKMFPVGPWEILAILAILAILIIIFAGPKKLPELARAVGKSIREFKKARYEATREFNDVVAKTEELTLKKRRRKKYE